MSLTKPLPPANLNPASKFVTCRAKEIFVEKELEGKPVKVGTGHGQFEYYEKPKEEGEEGKTIPVDFSKGIFILEYNLYSVTGYNEVEKYRIQSNEVRGRDDDGNIIQAILTVKAYPKDTKKKPFILAQGTYAEIKDKVCTKDIGGRFTRCIYFMDRAGDLNHLALHGNGYASFNDGIEKKSADVHKRWVYVNDWESKQNGSNEFMVPKFTYGEEIKSDDLTKAQQHDTVLQAFLEKYLKFKPKTDGSEHNENEGSQERPEEKVFDTKHWRQYREHDDQPFLGELPIAQLLQLKSNCEQKGDMDSVFYACLGQAAYDYQQIVKTGSWKDRMTKDDRPYSSLKLQELKDALKMVESHADEKIRRSSAKQFLEAAVEVKEMEGGEPIDGKAEILGEEDDIPF